MKSFLRPKNIGAAAFALLVVFAAVQGRGLFQETRRVPVVLYENGEARTFLTAQSTVGGFLREQGIKLHPQDIVIPPADASITAGLEVDLGRVERRREVLKEVLTYRRDTEYTEDLNVGEIIFLQKGKNGLREKEVEIYRLNGKEAFQKVLQSKLLRPVVQEVVLEGTGYTPRRYRLSRPATVRKKLEMEATAYYPGPEDTGPYADGLTATNQKAGFGVAAVDPRVIPLGSRLYVEGYGFALASDKGGAIKGKRIDLCFETYEEAVVFGRKKVHVYLLD